MQPNTPESEKVTKEELTMALLNTSAQFNMPVAGFRPYDVFTALYLNKSPLDIPEEGYPGTNPKSSNILDIQTFRTIIMLVEDIKDKKESFDDLLFKLQGILNKLIKNKKDKIFVRCVLNLLVDLFRANTQQLKSLEKEFGKKIIVEEPYKYPYAEYFNQVCKFIEKEFIQQGQKACADYIRKEIIDS